MNKDELIQDTTNKLKALPYKEILQFNDMVSQLSATLENKILSKGIENLVQNSKTFDFLIEEEDLYSKDDIIKLPTSYMTN
jgi:hypothetical protein